MNTFQWTLEDQQEWNNLTNKINELESKLKKYPKYYDLDIINDNAKKFKSTSEQIKHYQEIYNALELELGLLEKER